MRTKKPDMGEKLKNKSQKVSSPKRRLAAPKKKRDKQTNKSNSTSQNGSQNARKSKRILPKHPPQQQGRKVGFVGTNLIPPSPRPGGRKVRKTSHPGTEGLPKARWKKRKHKNKVERRGCRGEK